MRDAEVRPSFARPPTVVLTPIYRPVLTETEFELLGMTLSAAESDVVLVAPHDLPVGYYQARFPQARIVRAESRHLSSVRSYSEWLTTPHFYDLWCGYEWILICQTDAVLLGDPWQKIAESPTWDYIGAPWSPPVKVLTVGNRILVRSATGADRGPAWVGVVGRSLRVGNGGLSLRRVSIFREAAEQLARTVSVRVRHHIHEDVLWSAFGPRFGVTIAPEDVARSLFAEVLDASAVPSGITGLHGVISWPVELIEGPTT